MLCPIWLMHQQCSHKTCWWPSIYCRLLLYLTFTLRNIIFRYQPTGAASCELASRLPIQSGDCLTICHAMRVPTWQTCLVTCSNSCVPTSRKPGFHIELQVIPTWSWLLIGWWSQRTKIVKVMDPIHYNVRSYGARIEIIRSCDDYDGHGNCVVESVMHSTVIW